MMAGGEAYIELEGLAKSQTQIYPDSCDVGLISNPGLRAKIRSLCAELAQIYNSKSSRSRNTATWTCFIPFDRETDLYLGVNLSVTFATDHRRNKEFFLISILSDTTLISPFKE